MLASLRYPDGIVQEGMRDLFGHLGACQLARVIPAHALYRAWGSFTGCFPGPMPPPR
jgi:hypothetical protein